MKHHVVAIPDLAADPRGDVAYLNVVREISLAAGIPEPRAYVIEDGSMNAFATGRDPEHASVAVTRGPGLIGADRSGRPVLRRRGRYDPLPCAPATAEDS